MRSFIFIAIAVAVMLAAGPVLADRIILAPTGTVLAPGSMKAEGAMNSSDTSSRIYWAAVGLQKCELSVTRLQLSDSYTPEAGSLIENLRDGRKTDIVGLEISLMPETSLSPGFGFGAWDITDKTGYGRGYYFAASKSVPMLKEIPFLPVKDIQVHAGYGMNGIQGLFGGAEATLALGIKLSAEYFQEEINYAVGWSPAPTLQFKYQAIDGENFYGLQFSPPL